MSHECIKEEFLGRVKEFMENTKGYKATLFSLALVMLVQVGTFLFLWGGLTTTVKNNTEDINTILTKFDKVKIVGYAYADNGKK